MSKPTARSSLMLSERLQNMRRVTSSGLAHDSLVQAGCTSLGGGGGGGNTASVWRHQTVSVIGRYACVEFRPQNPGKSALFAFISGTQHFKIVELPHARAATATQSAALGAAAPMLPQSCGTAASCSPVDAYIRLFDPNA